MDFYFTDRSFRLIEIATTTANGEYNLTNDELVQSISDGSKTFTADLPFTPEQEKRVTEMTKVGNYVLFIDSRGHHNFQTIMETKKANFAVNITCLDATVDLADETVDAYTADKAYPIAYYLELFTRDSGFEIGVNEISNLSRKLKWDSTDETSKARILSVANQFDAELDFTFEITGTRVIKCYINIRKHNGSDKDIRLTLNHEVNAITTSENIWDLATSIRPIGGTPEGKDKPINLNGYKWTDPDGRYVLRGSTLLDTVANKYWTRLRTGGTSETGAYINRVITYEAVTQARLLQSALSDLKKRASVATTYEVDIAVLPDNVEIGDTVHIVDEKQELFLSARVLEMTESYALNTHKAILGDYLIEENEVSLSLQQLAEKMKTLANKPVYTWIAYADTADGQGISLFPDGKAYVGIAVNMADKETDINDPSVFNWQLTKGEPGQPGKDGSNGVPGAKGADGRTSYFHTAWADSENGSIGFTTSGGNGKKYVGTYSDFTKADSNEPSKYNWALFKGADGKDGYTPIKGTDYFDGKDGQDGKSSYLWIRYSANANGTGMTSDPTGAKYVGYATTQTATAPTSASAYKWQLVAGKDGIAGEKGTDGKTSYLHIRYSNDGGKTFTANSGESVGTYIGQYTDFTQADSNSVSAYKWALIKGEKGDSGADGLPGKDGVGIKSTLIQYASNTSGTVAPTSGWATTIPAASPGHYVWTKYTWTYTDGTTEAGYSVGKIGETGRDGADGIPGKAGADGRTPYFHQAWADSSDGKTSFSTTVSLGKKYLGTYTDYVVADSTDPTKYKWTELVGAIEIGGRNLIVRTGELPNTMIGPNGLPSALNDSALMENPIAVTAGESLVFSRYGQNTNNDNYFRFAFYDDNDAVILRQAKDDKQFVVQVPAGATRLKISYPANTDVKAERGNKVTDWSPAPEDVQAYIDNKAAETLAKAKDEINLVPKITSGTSFPSTRKTGDMHWMTNSAGVVTGYYKFNGSQWVVQKIDAQSLNVSSLSALSANLGTVTAGTINGVTINGSEFNTSNTFTDSNNAAKKVTNTQLINKDGYKMVVQRNWFDSDIVLETSIGTMGIISTSLFEKADFDADKAALSTVVIDPLNSNISIGNSDNSVLLNGDGLYLYDAKSSEGVQLKHISGGFQVLASPTDTGYSDAVLDLKGNKSGINFHVGDRDDIDYDSQIVVEGRYGKDPKTNRAKMHLFGNSVVLNCFDAVEVRGGNKLNDDYHAIRASAFNVSSNPEFKTNIKGYTGGLALVNETDVYRYALKDELKNDKYSDHIGMMLDNIPSEIVGDSEGVDLYSAVSVAWSAIKELSAKVEEQGKEIDKLKELAGGESSVEAN